MEKRVKGHMKNYVVNERVSSDHHYTIRTVVMSTINTEDQHFTGNPYQCVNS